MHIKTPMVFPELKELEAFSKMRFITYPEELLELHGIKAHKNWNISVRK